MSLWEANIFGDFPQNLVGVEKEIEQVCPITLATPLRGNSFSYAVNALSYSPKERKSKNVVDDEDDDDIRFIRPYVFFMALLLYCLPMGGHCVLFHWLLPSMSSLAYLAKKLVVV